MQLSELWIYPIKSCQALAQTQAIVEPRGLQHDRRYLLVEASSGRFLSAREHPKLLSLRLEVITSETMAVSAPELARRVLDAPLDARFGSRSVQVWDDQFTATRCDPALSAALSDWLGIRLELCFMRDSDQRLIDSRYATAANQTVSFADGYPMLLISTASLAELNARLHSTGHAGVSMRNFRPNLVVDGVIEPHAEDRWRKIRIGAVEFALVKPCVRCVLTTIDPDRLSRDSNNEPLKTLIGYRRSDKGVTFGMNLIALTAGALTLHSPVDIIQ